MVDFLTRPGRLSKKEIYLHLREILGKMECSDYTTCEEDKALLAAIEHFKKVIERVQRRKDL